jgi:hypothetical protein
VKYTSRTSCQSSLHRQKGFVFKLVHSMLIVAVTLVLILLYEGGHLAFLRHLPGKIIHFLDDDGRYRDGGGRNPDNSGYPGNPGNSGYSRTSYPGDIFPDFPAQQDHGGYDKYDSYRENALYSVQVAAAYDSRQLYDWRDELSGKGYKAYLVSSNTPRGMLFKLRIGPYRNRQEAENMLGRLGQYSQNFSGGFIVPGE